MRYPKCNKKVNMRLFLVGFLLIHFQSTSQKEYISKVEFPLIFFNYQNNKYTVIDDSLGCQEYNQKLNKWEFRKLQFNLTESFKDFLRGYEILHEKGSKIFFVDKGCGQVYVLENDTIKRDDCSSHHKNQFGGSFFLYKGEPHIFGGYGLFAFKNLITRYDVFDREWYNYEIDGLQPKPMYMSIGKVEKDVFYMISGNSQANKQEKKEIWSFNFRTKRWKNHGFFAVFFRDFNFSSDFSSYLDQEYLPYDNSIYQFLFSAEKYVIYYSRLDNKIRKIIPHNSSVLIFTINCTSRKAEVIITEKAKIFEKILFRGPLIKPIKTVNYGFIALILVGLLGVTSFLLVRFKKNRKRKIVNNSTSILDAKEKEILAFFITNKDTGIEISEINDFVNWDNPSIDTVKKRRENLLKDFKTKISTETLIPFEEIFQEHKHSEDKRIKLLILNPKVIIFYENNKSK